MTCLLLVLGLALPRVTLILLWLFTPWLGRAFGGWLIPLLGFVFVPYTCLWWAVVMNVFGGEWGFWQVLFLVVALIADLSAHGGAWRKRRT